MSKAHSTASREDGAALKPGPDPTPGATAVPPGPSLAPDPNWSVAGEEDPGAALDMVVGGAAATAAGTAAPEGDTGSAPRRPPWPR